MHTWLWSPCFVSWSSWTSSMWAFLYQNTQKRMFCVLADKPLSVRTPWTWPGLLWHEHQHPWQRRGAGAPTVGSPRNRKRMDSAAQLPEIFPDIPPHPISTHNKRQKKKKRWTLWTLTCSFTTTTTAKWEHQTFTSFVEKFWIPQWKSVSHKQEGITVTCTRIHTPCTPPPPHFSGYDFNAFLGGF